MDSPAPMYVNPQVGLLKFHIVFVLNGDAYPLVNLDK